MNSFQAQDKLQVGGKSYTIYKLDKVLKTDAQKRLPVSLKILLESLLRSEDGLSVSPDHIETLAAWDVKAKRQFEISFMPSRVVLQDFTGVPAVVDLAVMRDAVKRQGGRADKINPLLPVDLVIDHSVMVDEYASANSFEKNTAIEFKRNKERYQLLRWAQTAFKNFRAVPPGTGIVHQVNLEYLAGVVLLQEKDGQMVALPDSVVGTDSHTTMINGLGVLGWGVGGIEAEAAMLGQPISMLVPEVIGVRLKGKLPEGVLATDLVLTIVETLRKKGVVGKFVEFCGPGLDALSLTDRATIANMAPEYGATMGFFPVDDETIKYLRLTGRTEDQVRLVETYAREQGMYRSEIEPNFTDILEVDISMIEPSIAGPKRPQDRILLKDGGKSFKSLMEKVKEFPTEAEAGKSGDGSVVIAAITSCTNTSNPQVMIGAGLLAKKAVAKGLTSKPWVKTSLAPGSRVVIDYLKKTNLLTSLEALNFYLVGFGCTTCIGNSGPLPEEVEARVKDKNLLVAAVLSGNRNFEGRIHPLVKANYLASPPLVVAYAIAGTMNIDLSQDSLGNDQEGKPVFLKDIWPTNAEINEACSLIDSKMFQENYASVFEGDDNWKAIQVPEGETFVWDKDSTYVRCAPYFDNLTKEPTPREDIKNARVLCLLGDSVTTDHISPAGSITEDGPAGRYLKEHGVNPSDFNSFGSRRGNHEVMMRGTFANIRLKNLLAPGTEGGVTRLLPEGDVMSIFDASEIYRSKNIPLFVIAGKEYGTGSSRDWAGKGPALMGVKAVIAESYERIHRSNLIGMGVLPLEFMPNESAASLKLTGEETFDIIGIENDLSPRKEMTVIARSAVGEREFKAICRIDTPLEIEYYKHGGILVYVLRKLLAE